MPKRSIFAIPWSKAKREAWKDLSTKLQGPENGSAAELARLVLEEFLFSEMSLDEIRKRNLLPEWQREIPEPSLLSHALQKYAASRPSTSVPKIVQKK